MGTYMSAYIEIDLGKSSPPFADAEQIFSLTEGSFVFNKDYEVFDALADGRNSRMAPEDRDLSSEPLFAPRGLPSPCGIDVARDYFFLIVEPAETEQAERFFWPGHRRVAPLVAEVWLREKGCHESTVLLSYNCEPPGRIWRAVSKPGLYNASWLLLNEFEAALQHRELNLATLPVEYRIIHSAMKLLVDEHGKDRVRLVLWFS